MGKSKNVRKNDVQALRRHHAQWRAARYAVFITGALFIVALALSGGIGGFLSWPVLASLGAFVAANFWLRIASRCPYCDKMITGKFGEVTHCPHCRRGIRPTG